MVQDIESPPFSPDQPSQSLGEGAVGDQEKGYELFSASLSKAMKAYALYSDTQVLCRPSAQRTNYI